MVDVSVEVTVVVMVVDDLPKVGDEAREPDVDRGGRIIVVGIVVLPTRREPAPALIIFEEGDTGRMVSPIDEEEVGVLSFFFLKQEEVGRMTGPKGSMKVAPPENVGLTLLDVTTALVVDVLAVDASDVAGGAAALEEAPEVGMLTVTPASLQSPSAA